MPARLSVVCVLLLVAAAAADVDSGGGGRQNRRRQQWLRRTEAAASPPVSSPPAGAEGGVGQFRSVGRLSPLPRESLDLAQPGVPARVAKTRGWKGELILFTADSSMAGWGFHFVHQLRRQGYEHWMIMADTAANCARMHSQWDAMVATHGEEPLSCAYSSYPSSHPGWNQWQPGCPRGATCKRNDKLHNVYIFWASRWWVSLVLLREGVNILSLDVDAVLLTDIYARMRSPPLVYQDVLITRNNDFSQSLNCGFVYFNRDAPRLRAAAAAAAAAAVDAAAIDTAAGECGGGGGGGGEMSSGAAVAAGAVPAAEWVCELVWERVKLFLDVDRSRLARPPQREVLWEQDAWNDLVKSLDLRKRVFPWAVGYGLKSDLWSSFGYERVVLGGVTHREKFVQWRSLLHPRSPPAKPPDEPPFAGRIHALIKRTPLLWIPVCPPRNASSGADAKFAPGLTEGIELGLPSAHPTAAGRLMIAPPWLASLGNDPESDWAGANSTAGGPLLTYVHITNMWKCFPHPCWSKAGRLFWLRAHGFWDTRLDSLGLTPRGAPYTAATRALALPPREIALLQQLIEQTKALPGFPAPRASRYGFRRMHAIIHNLVTLAGLLGRVPVIPQLPCELIKLVQPTSNTNIPLSRFGVCHSGIVATGPDADHQTCHLAPGAWRPGGSDQCYHSFAMAQFDLAGFVTSLSGAPNGSLVFDVAPKLQGQTETPSEPITLSWDELLLPLDISPLRSLCGAASALVSTPLVHIEGLVEAALVQEEGRLVDSPLPPREFKSERLRQKSRRPRWRSLLQNHALQGLEDVCPGTKQLKNFRKVCVGFFLAE